MKDNGTAETIPKLWYNRKFFKKDYKFIKTKETEEWLPMSFFSKILKNCKKYNKFLFDITPRNIIKMDNGEYSLIDLEGIYDNTIEGKKQLKKHGYSFKPTNIFELIDNYK